MAQEVCHDRILAIDGPAGAGKSSVARRVAATLGYAYLDTGAMYRAVTLACLRAGFTEPLRDSDVAAILADLHLEFPASGRLHMNGNDVTDELRTTRVTDFVSAVSAVPAVREAMVHLQRQVAADLAQNGRGVVIDGRDIGSYVFPEARHRFYLDASVEERARRRRSQENSDAPLGEWVERIAGRDHKDSERAFAPLVVPEGAEVIDTTVMTEQEVVRRIVQQVRP